MTTKDFTIKWFAYAVGLLPVWFAQTFLFNRFPVFGVIPMLLPLAAVAVATLEGATPGAGFGLAVGILMDAVTPGGGGMMTLALTLTGMGAGLLSQYALRQDMIGCLFCSLLALMAMDGLRILPRLLLGKAPLTAMLRTAGLEIAWSMCFVPLIYLLFRWFYVRVPKATVL